MKKTIIFILLIIISSTACETLQQNLQARKNLAKCKYTFKKINLVRVELKGITPKWVHFDAYLNIKNNAASDVALDRVTGDIFLDNYNTSQFQHKHFITIKPGFTKTEKIRVKVDFAKALKALSGKPKNITLQAKVYMTIVIGKITLKTPFAFKVKQTFPIPWRAIQRQITRKGGKLFNTLKKGNYNKYFR